MAEGFDKSQVVVGEVEVRLARADERRRWDALMDQHHYLGFRQFAGRGLRHVAVWRGQWVALLGWQSGAFKCAPCERWVGWHRSVQFRRLHLIGNNTRFLILPEAQGIRNLASRVLGRSLRRVSADWEAGYGHPLELAEALALDCYSILRNRGRLGKVFKIRHLLELGIFLPMPLHRARWT